MQLRTSPFTHYIISHKTNTNHLTTLYRDGRGLGCVGYMEIDKVQWMAMRKNGSEGSRARGEWKVEFEWGNMEVGNVNGVKVGSLWKEFDGVALWVGV